jgi:hypothetical protein
MHRGQNKEDNGGQFSKIPTATVYPQKCHPRRKSYIVRHKQLPHLLIHNTIT